MARYQFIKKADQAVRFQIADGESLQDSPVLYINDATVTLNLYDESGDKVIDGLVLAYQSSSEGVYRGVVPSSGAESPSNIFDPPAGTGYKLEIIVSTPAGANRTFIFQAHVVDG